MKIGIIGAGNIGGTAATLFAQAGHDVTISNSRGPETLRELAASIGPRARPATVEDAARWADVVLLAIPWRKPEALPSPESVEGKVVIDAMNHYKPDFTLHDLGKSTSSEETQKRLPGARIVKAFNTIYFQHLATRGRKDLPVEQRHAIFLAGDDAEAKKVAAKLIEDIGFAPIDTGSLHDGGLRQQPGSDVYNQILTGREARERLG